MDAGGEEGSGWNNTAFVLGGCGGGDLRRRWECVVVKEVYYVDVAFG